MNQIFKFCQISVFLLTICFSQTYSQPWTGKWIWQAADGPENTWMCFRKTFTIDNLPSKTIANIAVDSKYWFWINGNLVIFEGGLKRGPTPSDNYYDQVDISSYLVEGKNTIAILVWYFGKPGFSHISSGKGGLFFEFNTGDSFIISDSTWKIKVHPAYESTGDPLPNYRLPESNIRFNAENDFPEDWTSPNFNDSLWSSPVEKGVPPTAPWNNLWLRPIPQWKNSGLINYANLSVTLPYTTTAQTIIIASLPYNAQITPYLEIVSASGKLIDVRTDNYNRSENSVRAEYVTKSDTQHYEAFGWMNGHNVRYTVPAGVTIIALKYRESGYDTELSGSFTCDDTYFNTLWKKAQRTLYINMRDNYMDCPDRERALWWGDAVIETGEAFYAVDRKSDLLAKKSISNLVEWQKNNVLFSPIPAGNWNKELPVQMLASIGQYGFWNYFWYSGDTAAIVDAYPYVKKYLSLWSLDGDGLVKHRIGDWDWEDWGDNIDTRLLDNCWYFMALKAARKMALLTKNTNDTTLFDPKIQSIRTNFNRMFWQDGFYRSPDYSGIIDDRGNGLAVVAELADSSKWPFLKLVLGYERNSSPYMEKYVLEALYMMGYENDALVRMKRADRYGSMVDDASTTLYELFGNGGTNNHAWSGGPLTLLSEYGAGVAPESAGFKTYHVFPQEGLLKYIKTITPSVKGNIITEIRKDISQYSLTLSSPSGTTAVVGIPKAPFEGKTIKSITINDKIVWQDGVSVGVHPGTEFIGWDNKYYKFITDPGEYNFSATMNNDKDPQKDIYKIYPVPAIDQITISNTSDLVSIELFTLKGDLLKREAVNSAEYKLNVVWLKPGIYILQLTDNRNISTVRKFVKTR